MQMIKELLFILGSFIVLIKSADIFVNSSISLARKFHISEVIIGCTIVSIGTTMPELLVSCISAYKGSSGMALGNGVGSIIFNAGIIASTTMLFGNKRSI